jgi:hypothetical protein
LLGGMGYKFGQHQLAEPTRPRSARAPPPVFPNAAYSSSLTFVPMDLFRSVVFSVASFSMIAALPSTLA